MQTQGLITDVPNELLQGTKTPAPVRPKRKSILTDIRLVTQNGLDVRVEKVKRQKRKSSDFVNGQYYPQPTTYGYRLTGLPQRTMTYFEVVELLTNWMAFMKSERA